MHEAHRVFMFFVPPPASPRPLSSVRLSFLVNLISEKQLDLRICDVVMLIVLRRCQVKCVCGDIRVSV